MQRWVLCGAALVTLSLVAPASGYTVKANVECPDIVREDADENYREMNKWWLLGYFTARNYVSNGDAGKSIDDNNIYQMALEYCRSNPSNDWDDAAIHVYDRLD